MLKEATLFNLVSEKDIFSCITRDLWYQSVLYVVICLKKWRKIRRNIKVANLRPSPSSAEHFFGSNCFGSHEVGEFPY